MTKAEIALVLNEWARRYAEDPEKFQSSYDAFVVVAEDDGKTYGETCADYMHKILAELPEAV